MNDDSFMRDDATVVAHRWVGRLAWAVCPVLGAALGWALPRVVPWLHDLPWLPFDGPLELVQRIPEPHVTIAATIVGAVGGVVLAAMVVADLVTITVTRSRLRVVRGDVVHDVLRSAIGSVHLEGKRLVVLDRQGAEMVREATDLPADAIRAAFTANGYPWSGADPLLHAYRPWVDGELDLPRGANDLLRRRAVALAGGKADRADELRAELAGMGVVVRDHDKRQAWRPMIEGQLRGDGQN